MPTHNIGLSARVTHCYITGWASEDEWVPLRPARLNGPTPVSSDDEGNSTVRHLLTLDVEGWAEARSVYWRHQPIYPPAPSFTRWLAHRVGDFFAQGCRCEHDCCGHRQTSASAVYIGKRRFSVELRHYLNV